MNSLDFIKSTQVEKKEDLTLPNVLGLYKYIIILQWITTFS